MAYVSICMQEYKKKTVLGLYICPDNMVLEDHLLGVRHKPGHSGILTTPFPTYDAKMIANSILEILKGFNVTIQSELNNIKLSRLLVRDRDTLVDKGLAASYYSPNYVQQVTHVIRNYKETFIGDYIAHWLTEEEKE